MGKSKYNPDVHRRRSIRLPGYDYAQAGWYFVTICVHDKRSVLGEIVDDRMVLNDFGRIVETEWLKTRAIRPNVSLDAHIVMPNHMHGIIVITDTVGASRRDAPTMPRLQANSLGAIIGQFKSVTTKRIRKIGLSDFKWQRNYYEHIIRNDIDLDDIREYIVHNPLKWQTDKYYV